MIQNNTDDQVDTVSIHTYVSVTYNRMFLKYFTNLFFKEI